MSDASAQALTVRRAQVQSGLVPIDATVLLGHVIGRDRAWLIAHGDDALDANACATFFALAKRRREGEPVAYLVGRREFFGLLLDVTPDVLIPRPETETLVEMALARIALDQAVRVLDLGTGSGAIALALAHERPLAHVLAVDHSAAALAVARGNAQRLGLTRVAFRQSDWFAQLSGERFDVIVSNPPYVDEGDAHLADGDVRFEPRAALTPGADGYAALRTIIDGARSHLPPGRHLLLEHGYDQSAGVRDLLRAAGYRDITAQRDLAGIPRVAAARLGSEQGQSRVRVGSE